MSLTNEFCIIDYLRPFATAIAEIHTLELWAQTKLLQSFPFTTTENGSIPASQISKLVNDVESLITDPSTNNVKELHLVAILPQETSSSKTMTSTTLSAALHFQDEKGKGTFFFLWFASHVYI